MLKFVSFSSGSCGNCSMLYSHSDDLAIADSAILIDAGVSLRSLRATLTSLGMGFDSLKAVLVTHDHWDHIRSLASYCKRLSVPVYATTELHQAMSGHFACADVIAPCRKDLREGEWNDVAGFYVRYFIVPHDATQTVGFAIRSGGNSFSIMTDVGRITDEAVEFARESDSVVIESNYDVDMLMSGPYPHDLKMRICQGHGHLSNDQCAEAVKRFYHPGLRNLFLCHLSEHNNTPSIAYKTVSEALSQIGVPQGAISLRTLPRGIPTPLISL
ncbi:MAG: MBL fold metallo-hydrolase [Bacteroidales bacterium]